MFAPSPWPVAAVAAGFVCASACQRREAPGEEAPVVLASPADWTYATHPLVPLAPEALREIVRVAFDRTSRFSAPAQPLRPADLPLAARASLRLVGAEAGRGGDDVVRVRARLEFVPPFGDDDAVTVVGEGSGRGRDGARAAVELAVSRAVELVAGELAARAKSDEELISELSAADAERSRTALDRLAARRHAGAFQPLVRALEDVNDETATRALSGLVSLDDRRAARPIIEASERRDLTFLLEAIYALGSLGGEDAEAYLFMVESGHPDPRVRHAAREALDMARRRAGRPAAAPEESPL